MVSYFFFSIWAITNVQSQALNSEIKCEKKGIMNKWDAEKKVYTIGLNYLKDDSKEEMGKENKKSRHNSFRKESKYWH